MAKHLGSVPRPVPVSRASLPPMTTLKTGIGGALKGVGQRQLGATIAGDAWVRRYLHPNDESASGGMPIPDNSSQSTSVSEIRHSGVLKSPYGQNFSWDLQILSLPTPDVPTLFRTRKSTELEWTPWGQFDANSGSLLSGYFQTKFRAGDNVPGPVRFPSLLAESSQFRQSFRGITVVMNSNSLSDEGFVTAGQWGVKPENFQFQPADVEFREGVQTIDALLFNDIPGEPDEVVNKCPQAGQWEARRGIYMPMRFSDAVHDFKSGEGSEWETPDSNIVQQVGKPIILAPPSTDGKVNQLKYLVWRTKSSTDPLENYQAVCTAGPINQGIGCIIFSGINEKASFVIKVRSGLETVADSNSPSGRYSASPPDPDPTAIILADSIGKKLPIVFEHKYNSLGFLGPLIAKAANWVIPTALPWLADKLTGWIKGRTDKFVNDASAAANA